MSQPTQPDASTRAAEDSDARHSHSADRPPTEEEAAAAERGQDEVDGDIRDVADHYEEMTDLGAHVKGEHAASARAGVIQHVAALGQGELAGDGQPEADAARVGRDAWRTVECLEDALPLIGSRSTRRVWAVACP